MLSVTLFLTILDINYLSHPFLKVKQSVIGNFFKVHFALQHQLFFVPFHLDEISFHFQSACVLRSEMSLFCSASIHINVYRCASIHILGGIHSPTLYFLIRPFSPFSFKVISDRYALIAVLLNVF